MWNKVFVIMVTETYKKKKKDQNMVLEKLSCTRYYIQLIWDLKIPLKNRKTESS